MRLVAKMVKLVMMLVAVWLAGTNVTWLARDGNLSIYMHLRMHFLLTTRLVSAQDSRLLGQASNLLSSIIQNDQSFFLVKISYIMLCGIVPGPRSELA